MGLKSARWVFSRWNEDGEVLTVITGGRPDVMKLVKETVASWGAEVVFITSNYQGNKEIMEGCKEAGIPAFVCHLRHHLFIPG